MDPTLPEGQRDVFLASDSITNGKYPYPGFEIQAGAQTHWPVRKPVEEGIFFIVSQVPEYKEIAIPVE